MNILISVMNKKFVVVVVSVLVLFGLTGCPIKIGRNEKLEIVRDIAQYMMDNSESDDVELFQYYGSDESFRFEFYGVTDLTTVDNMIYSLYEYLDENPDCGYCLDSTSINATFYPNSPSQDYDMLDWYVSVGNYDNTVRYDPERVRTDGLVYLDIYETDDFCLSEFADLKCVYKIIEVPPNISLDNLDVLVEMNDLEKFTINCYYQDVVYETYVSLCYFVDDINSRCGEDICCLCLSYALENNWSQEYGDDFVRPAYMNSEG